MVEAEPPVAEPASPASPNALAGPLKLTYPDAYHGLLVGAGVYFHPVVNMRKAATTVDFGLAPDKTMEAFEDFINQAYEFCELFHGPAKLDHAMLKSLWDKTAQGTDEDLAKRVQDAVAQFLLEGIPESSDMAFFDGLAQTNNKPSRWRHAKGALITQRMMGNRGKHLTFSADPPLPDGIVLATRTGVISGKPTKLTSKSAYTITCKNEAGEASCELELEVQQASPPANLTYGTQAHCLFTGEPITLRPQVEGAIDKWSCREGLPAGLHIDPHTGELSGVPADLSAWKQYTILAKNDSGVATCKVTISVVQAPPSDLKYFQDGVAPPVDNGIAKRATCGKEALRLPLHAHMCLNPSFEGEVLKFTIAPSLPEQLALNEETGLISGVPMVASSVKQYTVTATNESGECKVKLLLGVEAMNVKSLGYPQVDEVYHVGECVQLEPHIVGSATSWTVEPALPEGLSLDPSNGHIKGTPVARAEEACYTVTASCELGGTSTVLTFAVVAQAPEDLTFPGYFPGAHGELHLGQKLSLRPQLAVGSAQDFSVEPSLPRGLKLDPATGTISGSPAGPFKTQVFTVTARNLAGATSVELEFNCAVVEDQPNDADQDFAAEIENVVDIKALPAEPSVTEDTYNWMVWMVHRVWLNDPSLKVFSFNGLKMPLPNDEPRVAPKLTQALARNTHITHLDLSGSGLRSIEGKLLAKALEMNTTLKTLNVDSNNLDVDAVESIANALMTNKNSALETWECNRQVDVGTHFGRQVEQAVCSLMNVSTRITKLTIEIHDSHLRSTVERKLRQNDNVARRARKQLPPDEKVEEKQLALIRLSTPPARAAAEAVAGSDLQALLCDFASQKKRLPTKEQLQAYAKNRGVAMKYSEVAPLLKRFRGDLLDSVSGSDIMAVDPGRREWQGSLSQWTEKNDRWNVKLCTPDGKSYAFVTCRDLTIEVSDDVADWLRGGTAAGG